ncbi:MAG: hypothetical protein ACRDFQ_04885 [Anaerolineales bacterium]
MQNRRTLLAGGACALGAPYFFFTRTVKADQLTGGLVKAVTVVADSMDMRPAGPQTGADVGLSGGGTIVGRGIRGQADLMARDRFTEIDRSSEYTRQLCSNGFSYTFVRFRKSFHNCCLPLGVVADQSTEVYAGAMTLLEGPNLVALQAMTNLLKQRHYSPQQITDLCWPLRPSYSARRERALIQFESISQINGSDGQRVYADRDVLYARKAKCVLRYTHSHGVPDGGGEGALIINEKVQLRYEFKFDTAILRS